MPDRKGALVLDPRMLVILALPFAVISISFLLMPYAGAPLDPLAKAVVDNGHAEAAGRLKMLATWLLLFTIGCACIGYFIVNLGLFASRTWWWLVAMFIVMAALGGGPILYGAAEGPRLMGEKAICDALAARAPAQPTPPVSRGQAASAPAAGSATDNSLQSYDLSPPASVFEGLSFLRQPDCPADTAHWRMHRMWQLNFIQRLLLTLVSPALVLGTIACLAIPPRRTARPAGRSPADRLKIHLYLTAALFVSGLLFLSALLRWPAFAFQGAGREAYVAHVDAFVLYWGVTYTLYIASYYVPVALLLTAQGVRDGVDEDKLPAGQLLDWTKTLAALFAPAIVGLLGNVIHL